ncbi:MAG: FAD-binding oxidoreductase [Bryobacterales bacterium]|nr:FAD-binding oxidoreductase [Bryobacterales bacterium]MEB2361081.1 FAD-binding oxidoreductase [Bryobacterales bacterium]
MSNAALDHALNEWASLLGPAHVLKDAESVEPFNVSTFASPFRTPAVLRPATTAELCECLRIANRLKVPVYPISSGMNWGYGSRLPSSDSCVIIELSRMNRILEFDEDLGYVTVEPGVTQRQLFDFLKERKSRLWMDATGAHPDCSLIGNTVERGFGHTPYADHFANSCGLEVVLPTGEVVETGFARFEGAKAAPTYRWGVGPTLDGMFSQSNLGIVTRMSVWLMPIPEHFEAYSFQCSDEALAAVIDALRPLRMDGTLRSAVHIGNDYKVLSARQQYPWNESAGETPLSAASMKPFRKKLHFSAWNGFGALYGTRVQVAESKRLLKHALAGRITDLKFLNDRKIRLMARLAKPLSFLTGWDINGILEVVEPVYELMRGVPTDKPLSSTYWRKRTPVPSKMDPDRDRCGLLWCSPVTPTHGAQAQRLVQLSCDLVLSHGFEPIISLTLITERAIACIISLSYDRDIEGEDDRAMTCYKALLRAVMDAGYYPYRLGVQSMWAMGCGNGFDQLLRSIKDVVDPNGILAPGRYEPPRQPAPQSYSQFA